MQPAELRGLVLRARDAGESLDSQSAAFNLLVSRVQDFAVGAAYVYLRDLGLAQDAAQESLIIAWRRLDELRDPDLLLAWLKRIVASQCHRLLRKKSTRFTSLTDVPAFVPGDFEQRASRDERERWVRDALDHLPAGERAVVVLFYFSGKNQTAIARFLEIPQTTVVKRLYSARKRLAAALAPLETTIESSRPSRNREFAAMIRAGIYDDYVGLYRFNRRPDLTVKIERVRNRLVTLSAGQRNTVQLGARLSELRSGEFDGQARFVRGSSGRVTHFVYYKFGRRLGTATKLAPGLL